MSFSVDVNMQVPPDVYRAMDSRRGQAAIVRGMRTIGHRLMLTARAGIRRRNKSGRVYNFRGRRHRAGAPGEYPARRTGNLGRSINYRARGYQLSFGTNIRYARYLQPWNEADRPTNSWRRVAPRPMLQLAHDELRNQFQPIMYNAVRTEFNI